MGRHAHKKKIVQLPKSGQLGRVERRQIGQKPEEHAFLQIQSLVGSQAMQRLLQAQPQAGPAPGAPNTHTSIERFPFRATIARGPVERAEDQPQAALTRQDAGPGEEQRGETFMGLFQQIGAAPAGSASAGVETGEPSTEMAAAVPIPVPDIEIPMLAEIGKTDAVKGGFTYSGSIKRGGARPSGFGVTRSFNSKLKGITITSKAATYEVSATFEHPITYQVRSGAGPSRQKDIASATDADITKAKYPKVVSDLTPNMSDLDGRPPREKYWAEDLTLKHELVHADDDKKNAPGAMATVTTWLNGQTAASVAEVRTLLGKLPGRFATALLAALSTEDGEKHAYGDGAPSYKARADAIDAKGKKGDYK
jgi:hypothetical protein